MNLKNIKPGDSIEFYQPGYRGNLIYCRHKIASVTKKVATTENGLKFAIPSGFYIDEIIGKPIPNPVAEKVNAKKLKKSISVNQARRILQKMPPEQQIAVKRMINATVKDTMNNIWRWEEFSQEHPQIAARPVRDT